MRFEPCFPEMRASIISVETACSPRRPSDANLPRKTHVDRAMFSVASAARPTAEMGADFVEQPVEPVESALPPDLTGKTVWVIDSHSLIFQVFHALPEMTSPRGEPTGAVFGFTRDMINILDQKKPDYLF